MSKNILSPATAGPPVRSNKGNMRWNIIAPVSDWLIKSVGLTIQRQSNGSDALCVIGGKKVGLELAKLVSLHFCIHTANSSTTNGHELILNHSGAKSWNYYATDFNSVLSDRAIKSRSNLITWQPVCVSLPISQNVRALDLLLNVNKIGLLSEMSAWKVCCGEMEDSVTVKDARNRAVLRKMIQCGWKEQPKEEKKKKTQQQTREKKDDILVLFSRDE